MIEGGPSVEQVVSFEELPSTAHAREFVGADHGGVPFSFILISAPPGAGPQVHRHPYPEVFIVESGLATFQLGDQVLEVAEGHLVIGPPDVPHGFTNTGSDMLRLIAVHGAPRFQTEWLADVDRQWVVDPSRQGR